MPNQETRELNLLLDLLNQSPVGLISCDLEGNFILMNASSTSLLYPICLEYNIELNNMFEVLSYLKSEMAEKVTAYEDEYGTICENEKIILSYEDGHTDVLNTTIKRLGPELFLFIFQDYTEQYQIEEQLRETIEDAAIQAGRLEMSSGVLHDIGNVATAFGTEIFRIKNTQLQTEITELQKLQNLFQAKHSAIDHALGTGKAAALGNFLDSLSTSLSNKQSELTKASDKLYTATSHIQEILNIQRHYISGRSDKERAPLNIQNLLNDALAIMDKPIQKRNIRVVKNYHKSVPLIIGDETKLIQVLINLIKNSVEAFDEMSDEERQNPSLEIQVAVNDQEDLLEIVIEDNACGFDPAIGATLFESGVTTKTTGSGIGLKNVKEIIESHHGEISIESPGKNKGAKTNIKLHLSTLKKN